jgi:hypothetical protein
MAAEPVLTIWHTALGDETYLVRASDVEAFRAQLPQLRNAPLRLLKTDIKDNPKRSYLIVSPPLGLPVVPRAGPSKKRRPNDHKQLTPLGIAASTRTKAGAGELRTTRDTVIWRLVYGCAGDAQCDPVFPRKAGCSCSLRVIFTATAAQIARGDQHGGFVQAALTGRHRANGKWIPPAVGCVDPAKQARLSAALADAQRLRVDRGVLEAGAVAAARLEASGQRVVAHNPAARARELASVATDLAAKQQEASGLRREMRPSYGSKVTDLILKYTADGYGALRALALPFPSLVSVVVRADTV